MNLSEMAIKPADAGNLKLKILETHSRSGSNHGERSN